MFDTLTGRLDGIFKKLRSRGKLHPKQVDVALTDMRTALLEADVAAEVADDLLDRVRERALSEEVMKSLTPAQQVIKVVRDELQTTMGGTQVPFTLPSSRPAVVMMAGVQGSGKTTACAKIALHLKSKGKRPLLVAADLWRPAAVEQLVTLGGEIGVDVVSDGKDAVKVAKAGVKHAGREGYDVVIADTAGRLHVDETMLDELKQIRAAVKPHHVLLVVDAMTGQDAVTVADRFNQAVGIDAVILTKMDGDSRGGAALSVRHVTGRPIAFVGMGEKTDALEPFHPDRLASRILGMGDIVSLVEKAQQNVDQAQAEEMVRKLREETFTLEDFRAQLKQVRALGPLDQIMGMLPFGKMLKGAPKELSGEQADLDRFEAIIGSMTPGERRHPEVINGSRRQRIARGSGSSVQDVNRLLKQFAQLKKMMKGLKQMEGRMGKMKGGLPFLPR